MEKPLPGQQDYLEASIKTAQYLAGLTTQQDIWAETGKVLVNFFGADVCAFGESRADGEITGHHWTFSEQFPGRRDLEAETKEAIAEVLESGFLTSRIISTPDPLSVACFPITQENQVIAVMLVGHRMSEPLPKELLNVYLAVAGMVGTTATRLASEQELRRHRQDLEQLVKERTAELTNANKQMQREITERKQAEQRLSEEVALKNFLIDLYNKEPVLADKDLYDYVLDYVGHLTDSTIGFFHLVSDDQKNVILTTWNTEALRNCTASYATHYPLDQAGNWVDCVRLRRPVIYNEFSSSPNRKGLPEGHTPIRRFMSVPVVEGDKVRIIFGVGNKPEEYSELDAGRIQVVANDLQRIIARRRAEIALSSSEAHFRSLIENASDIITILNADGTVRYMSPSLERVVGFKPSELVHRNIFEYVHPEDLSAARDIFIRTIQNPDVVLSTELRLLHNDGSWRILELVCQNMLENEAVKGILINSRDITDRKQAEEALRTLNEKLEEKVEERTRQLLQAQQQLIRKEKLSILGQLAGVVGHEIRNPLGVMNNAVYFLKTVMTDADDTVKEYLDIIKQEIDNSQRIITDLLDFARTKTPQAIPVVIRGLVTESLGRCIIPENINVQTDIPYVLPEVNVDPFQMGQVLQNLITNAIQAMPNGGALTVAARRVSSHTPQAVGTDLNLETCDLLPETDTNFVEITVTDTGEGISPENMEKLFQPLFTTKAKGIGLGLVVCKNLVEANGGRIEVESKVGKGTTFLIILS